MRYKIPLRPIPNQRLSTYVGGANYDIAIRFTGSVMAVDISRDGTPLLTGGRAVQNAPLLTSKDERGNFTFITEDDQYPSYLNFGSSCELVYSEDPKDALWTN